MGMRIRKGNGEKYYFWNDITDTEIGPFYSNWEAEKAASIYGAFGYNNCIPLYLRVGKAVRLMGAK